MYNNVSITDATLPMMVVKNIVPLPNNDIRFDVANAQSKEALNVSNNTTKNIILFVQNNPVVPQAEELNNLLEVGVICRVISYTDGNIGNARLLGLVRCKLNQIVQKEPYYIASVTTIPKQEDLLKEETDYVKLLNKAFEFLSSSFINSLT